LENLPIVKENMFESHPYRWSTIGSMEHLDTATLEDFHKNKYPQQCCFSSAGDFEKTKQEWIENTLALSKKAVLKKQTFIEKPITQTIKGPPRP
jgi:predicted Zn-dependent peptidase